MRLLVCAIAIAAPLGAATCESLAALKLPATDIAAAQTVAAGGFTAPGATQPDDAAAYRALPAFCRVQGVIHPSNDSHIEFEVWMPSSGWNGRYLGEGNGGFAGSIGFSRLADALANGYAASGTDTGHRGSAIDATWALGHPEKVIDFGYRAIHETAGKAKALIQAFYGNPQRHSYFSSCSNGGRQALMEAQRYPADYDGILAGAPANFWTHLMASGNADGLALSDPAAYIPASKLPAIQAATLAACDELDGVKDGVIDDPSRCHFDPSKLLCQGAESAACLTAPQVATLRKLYTGTRDSAGKLIFPGHVPGGETGPNAWTDWIVGAAPGRSLLFAFGTQFFGNMVLEEASWNLHTFQLDRDLKTADHKLAAILNATDPDLSRFRARGGKLIVYHGWNDAAISPLNSIDYYRGVETKLGARVAAEFMQLYMVPGMEHCTDGPGPHRFGQDTVAPAEPGHSIATALEQWVENGVQPRQVIAAGASRTRPLCPYPQAARYKGTGSTDEAANFTCAAVQ